MRFATFRERSRRTSIEGVGWPRAPAGQERELERERRVHRVFVVVWQGPGLPQWWRLAHRGATVSVLGQILEAHDSSRVFRLRESPQNTRPPPHRVEIAKTALVVAQTQDGALRPHAALPRATRGPPALPGTAAALWDGVPTRAVMSARAAQPDLPHLA